MKKFKVTIKEKFTDRPIVTHCSGFLNEDEVAVFYGCNEPDVEWYKIEEE